MPWDIVMVVNLSGWDTAWITQ